MTHRVLVPIDGSEMAEHALEYALETHPEAEITVLHIAGAPSAMMGASVGLALESDIEEAAEERAAEIFDGAREIADSHGVEIETDVSWGSPAKAIVNHADGFDVVVIGSHSGTLADRLIVGNVAQKVVQHSPVPVTVVR
ncbi:MULTISPECIES: universal stress protein [Halolamina]|uniref:Nucleotide-binding universal stress protein, UspA family n=1 Tax=Halolamina pelagica TaxID=699431 RepID=A0A1I5TMW4_9EURY|nr:MULTISPECIES: universal stress protein [Halolamina]NHX37739.1 universal stress protein [Halolamina sp. R1-12]SFP84399.1 Nucleotide-binding universal stress protein, UspA family [Halolamina pelagica]